MNSLDMYLRPYIVELDHNVVDVVDAFPILAAIVRKEVRCTANRRKAHQHDLSNIDIVQILHKSSLSEGSRRHMSPQLV